LTKNRYVNTYFWDDRYISDCDPIEKLLFLYFLTNPLTHICGIYEIMLKRIALDTGIDKEMILKILARFEQDKKMKYSDGWIAIRNFAKHQKHNPNIVKGIEAGFSKAPENLVEWVIGKPLKGFQSLREALNYINLNLNLNRNGKANVPCLSDEEIPD